MEMLMNQRKQRRRKGGNRLVQIESGVFDGFDGMEMMNGGVDEDDMTRINYNNISNNNGGAGVIIANNSSSSRSVVESTRTSELTVAFEGEVYVFPAVTPEKLQAVLFLLGEADTPSSAPSVGFLLPQNARSAGDASRGSKLSRRMASLVRFREKRKERCFEKKIRYSCRKEVAQRMHRKNGQFASTDGYCADAGNWEPNSGTSHPESVCQHCGISSKDTPAMRRGPSGPRTLCNACGLMWANKGTLRDLNKAGRHIVFNQNEPATPDVKPSTMKQENPYANLDEEESQEESKPVKLNAEDAPRPNEQDLLETDETATDPLPMHVENSTMNLDEEDFENTLDELGDVSGSDFEIPDNFDDQIHNTNLQVDIEDSSAGTEWPGT